MNPLCLSGAGVQIQTGSGRSSAELVIRYKGRPDRLVFRPRQMEHDSIVLENCSGHVTFQGLRWLSKHGIGIYFLDFDGSVISNILPPMPVKADIRLAQFEASRDSTRKFTIARSLVEAKIHRSLQVLTWLSGRYDVQLELRAARREAARLGKAQTITELRSIEAHVAVPYWSAFRKALPQDLDFKGRSVTSRNDHATDPVNAALNYGYGFLAVECRRAINAAGLEAGIGYLHTLADYQTKESLIFDLQEPYRWLIDLCVIQTFEEGALDLQAFEYAPHDYRFQIEDESRRRLVNSLKETFNTKVLYRGERLGWDSVISEKTNELARFLTGKTPTLDFTEPAPLLERTDSKSVRERILNLTQSEAEKIGLGKSELHYLRQKAQGLQGFRLYGKVKDRITQRLQTV
jgi:CRISPR-associated protein Cas1